MPRTRQPIPEFLTNKFTVLIDSNETLAYSFQNIRRRHKSGQRLPLIVPTERIPLWSTDKRTVMVGHGKRQESHDVGWADYSIKGFHDKIQLERKTVSDLFGTIAGRHSRFEAEIKRLHEDCLFSAVIIEGTLAEVSVFNTDASTMQVRDETDLLAADTSEDDGLSFDIDTRPRFGKTSPAVVLGTISSWKLKYPNVHWDFCTNRSMAEMWTFQLLSEFWDKVQEGWYPEIGPFKEAELF